MSTVELAVVVDALRVALEGQQRHIDALERLVEAQRAEMVAVVATLGAMDEAMRNMASALRYMRVPNS